MLSLMNQWAPASWIGLSIAVIVALGILGYFWQPARKIAVGLGLAIGAILFAYAKGSRDRGKLEQEKDKAATKKAQAEYDKIEQRPDTNDEVKDRLGRGTF